MIPLVHLCSRGQGCLYLCGTPYIHETLFSKSLLVVDQLMANNIVFHLILYRYMSIYIHSVFYEAHFL